MESTEFDLARRNYLDLFEAYAGERFLNYEKTAERTLFGAIKYCFFAGGKRVRPLLMLAFSDLFGADRERVLPFAFALECIHTYSLIHDDLPCMDNDDFRRGKPSCHRAFGEDIAVLAGDALLNIAFSVCAEECYINPDKKTALCAKTIADCAGVEGMITGQALDVLSEKNKDKNAEILYKIQKNKTAKLFEAAVAVPCILAGGDLFKARESGEKIGLQFQIADDISDAEKDLAAGGKLTFVTLYGKDAAKKKVEEYYAEIVELLEKSDGAEFLSEFFKILKGRTE